jgi:hypothetical protein
VKYQELLAWVAPFLFLLSHVCGDLVGARLKNLLQRSQQGA